MLLPRQHPRQVAKTNQIHRLLVLANGAAVNTSQTQLYPPLMPHLSVSSRVEIIEWMGVCLWERNIARDHCFALDTWYDEPHYNKGPGRPGGGTRQIFGYMWAAECLEPWHCLERKKNPRPGRTTDIRLWWILLVSWQFYISRFLHTCNQRLKHQWKTGNQFS